MSEQDRKEQIHNALARAIESASQNADDKPTTFENWSNEQKAAKASFPFVRSGW